MRPIKDNGKENYCHALLIIVCGLWYDILIAIIGLQPAGKPRNT